MEITDELKSKYPNLQKKRGVYEAAPLWTIENIRDGFQYFFDQNSRYPTAQEIESFEFLPATRTIQRKFNGLRSLRSALKLDGQFHYGEGEFRSRLAREGNLRAKKYEEEFYNFLISNFPEVNVHEHKILRPGGIACDFFVYTSESDGFAVDLFYAANLKNVGKIVNLKTPKYEKLAIVVYFVLVGNADIKQELIDKLIQNRRSALPTRIRVLTEDIFKQGIIQTSKE